MLPIITLSTDLGLSDGYVGVMKGVILGIAPDARIVDLSHEIAPQDMREAAIILDHSAFAFPEGTIHVCVVGPDTAPRPIAALIGQHRFVCPDNGTLTRIIQRAQRERWSVEVLHLDQPRFWRGLQPTVFHGRDLYAPVAAHLAAGTFFTAVGTPITDPVLLPIAAPRAIAKGRQGEVIYLDRFGNVTTNLRAEDLAELGELRVRAGDTEVRGVQATFGARPAGELIAYYSSHGELALAVINGNAAQQLKLKLGDPVEVTRAR